MTAPDQPQPAPYQAIIGTTLAGPYTANLDTITVDMPVGPGRIVFQRLSRRARNITRGF
jgi:hypothetical protein